MLWTLSVHNNSMGSVPIRFTEYDPFLWTPMPVDFLSETQRAAYSRYAGEPPAEQLARYFHLDAHDRSVIATRRGDENRLGFAVQLGTVRFLGIFLPRPTEVPDGVVRFVATQLGIRDTTSFARYAQRTATHREHASEIQKRYGYRPSSRRILQQINRGEGRHSVARAVFFGKRGELRRRYKEGQEDQLGALGLVVNAIVLWNTRYLDAVLSKLQADGDAIADADARRLSPLVHKHLNFLGRYHFSLPGDVRGGELRELRDPNAGLEEEWLAALSVHSCSVATQTPGTSRSGRHRRICRFCGGFWGGRGWPTSVRRFSSIELRRIFSSTRSCFPRPRSKTVVVDDLGFAEVVEPIEALGIVVLLRGKQHGKRHPSVG